MEIYKINHICINQLLTRFALSYNKGIIVYDLKTFERISSSNRDDFILGEVLITAMFYDLDLLAFTGSKNNQKYHNRKLVLWDIQKSKVVSSTQFKSEIVSIKVIKRLIIVVTKEEINICSFNEIYNVIEIIHKISIDDYKYTCVESWLLDNKYYIANVLDKNNVDITSIYENCLESQKLVKLNLTQIDQIQNIFYIEKLNLLFVVDMNGSFIKGFSLFDFKLKYEFYRGKNNEFVSHIMALTNDFIAVASTSKTVHIFKLENNLQSNNNYFNMFYSYINTSYNLYNSNTSIMKIRLEEFDKNDFFYLEFKKKGSLLLFDDIEKILTCLCYNGMVYKYLLDFDKLEYKFINKYNWCYQDNLKSSVFMSEEFCFDLVSLNKTKLENNEDNWKII